MASQQYENPRSMSRQIFTGRLDSAATDPAPEIEYWPAAADCASGAGLIIFPGGGYAGLADHEGAGYAEYFAPRGVACFVTRYRLGSAGHRHPAMLEDALAAVATVRRRAGDFGVDPGRIGVMGSSAGGHLTAHTLVGWEGYEADVPLRPDFGALCYPVILMSGQFCHTGSRGNLLGPDADDSAGAAVSPERLVTDRTPPCFLWHTAEDPAVPAENSMMFASALSKCNVPYALHICTRGGHGVGLGAAFGWADECLRWIDEIAATAP